MNTPAAATTPRRPLTLSSTLGTLVRRELWEHPVLWRAPLICAGLFVGGIALATLKGASYVHIDNEAWNGAMTPEHRAEAFAASQLISTVALGLITAVVLTFYLIDCLYAERKDRSILFWKSMPVSDGLTVLSKLLVALIVVPLGVLALAAVCQGLLFLLWQVIVAQGHAPPGIGWNMLLWLKMEGVLLLCLVLGALWYAPLAAAFLLLSAWIRRNPVVWATLIPFVPLIVEKVTFNTHHVLDFFSYRTTGIWRVLATGHGVNFDNGGTVNEAIADLNFAGAFTSLNLWLGVLAAAGLIYATVRVRRYRDDTGGRSARVPRPSACAHDATSPAGEPAPK